MSRHEPLCLSQHNTELADQLRVEARAAAKLAHPNIVRVFDIGESEAGEPFIVMELLSGESLGAALAHGPLSAISHQFSGSDHAPDSCAV